MQGGGLCSGVVCVCVCDAQSFQQTPSRSLTYITSLQHCSHCSNVRTSLRAAFPPSLHYNKAV